MTIFNEVVLALFSIRITREPAFLAQVRKAVSAPSDELMYVCLVAGIPQQCIAGALENSVQCQRELYRS